MIRPSADVPTVLSYSATVDQFFANNIPWLVWLVAVAVLGAFVPVVKMDYWITPVLVSLAVPVAWSACLDFRVLRATRRDVRGAALDVVLQRAVLGSWRFSIS
jgi:hypothetical protein